MNTPDSESLGRIALIVVLGVSLPGLVSGVVSPGSLPSAIDLGFGLLVGVIIIRPLTKNKSWPDWNDWLTLLCAASLFYSAIACLTRTFEVLDRSATYSFIVTRSAVFAVGCFTATSLVICWKNAKREMGAPLLLFNFGPYIMLEQVKPWAMGISAAYILVINMIVMGAIKRRTIGRLPVPK